MRERASRRTMASSRTPQARPTPLVQVIGLYPLFCRRAGGATGILARPEGAAGRAMAPVAPSTTLYFAAHPYSFFIPFSVPAAAAPPVRLPAWLRLDRAWWRASGFPFRGFHRG